MIGSTAITQRDAFSATLLWHQEGVCKEALCEGRPTLSVKTRCEGMRFGIEHTFSVVWSGDDDGHGDCPRHGAGACIRGRGHDLSCRHSPDWLLGFGSLRRGQFACTLMSIYRPQAGLAINSSMLQSHIQSR